jgi:hypothetical protein
MADLDFVVNLFSRRYYVETAYFAAINAIKTPTAMAHMLAGVGCCGCAEPLADLQKLFEGSVVTNQQLGDEIRISPNTALYYEGFFHLLQAFRMDPLIKAPSQIHEVLEDVINNLAYISRRELYAPPNSRKKYTFRIASVAAACLIQRLINSNKDLPGVMPTVLDQAANIIAIELTLTGGDSYFFKT